MYYEVKKAPLLDDLMPDLDNIFNSHSVTSFDKTFDLGFLKARGINIPYELPCIMKAVKNLLKIQFPSNTKKYKWSKCEEAWEFFFPNSFYIEKHRALDDALHEATILFEIYRRGLLPIFNEVY